MAICIPRRQGVPAPTGDHLTWHRTTVAGRRAAYGVGGPAGPPVVFLHGWALGSRAYKRAVRRLTTRGCRVYAPAMPSFGGTPDLPLSQMSFARYAAWVDAFMDAVGIEEPAVVIGHSSGGGVATKLAHLRPDRVRYLVLLNAVGGVASRPPWAWVAGFGRELWPLPQAVEMAQAVRADLVPNLIRNPVGLARAGLLAQRADLKCELAELRDAGVPVLVLTSDADGVIPRTAFEALCAAVGADGRIVSGRHSWLLADPDSFGDVLASVVEVQVAEHRTVRAATRAGEITGLLANTQLPRRTARTLLREAPPLWLISEAPETLAGDLALCHPRLRRGGVRAIARPIEGSTSVRLTVVAADRPGLLADSAAVLARNQLSITDASAATWPRRRLALHSFTLDQRQLLDDDGWAVLGDDLRTMVAAGTTVEPSFRPVGAAQVAVHGADVDRSVVRVTARDQIGLLSLICRWFAQHGTNIESVNATTDRNTATATFLVVGSCDGDELAAFLEAG